MRTCAFNSYKLCLLDSFKGNVIVWISSEAGPDPRVIIKYIGVTLATIGNSIIKAYQLLRRSVEAFLLQALEGEVLR